MDLNEKLVVLRGVSLFSEVPEREMTEVAALLEEMTFKAGERIFEEGDRGYCMYIIASGRIRIHNGEHTLNFLGKRDVFGEMAALVPEPRIATATAIEDTVLLQLYQHPLYKLMEEHIKVVRGIISVLCRHLRARVRELAEDALYRQELHRLTEAVTALETGTFDPKKLNDLALRNDELGQVTQSFQRMISAVQTREQRLTAEVEMLRQEVKRLKEG
ncbi:MAG: cyclic nucleotide-binding domain-containing protein [Ardenticatenales bacterium]|nr:cyclic nucleotide-binding domain-containing protein [Ardenticatenales bacterium]